MKSAKSKKRSVRSGIRTHAYRSRLRPERSALDRSAILTNCKKNALSSRNTSICITMHRTVYNDNNVHVHVALASSFFWGVQFSQCSTWRMQNGSRVRGRYAYDGYPGSCKILLMDHTWHLPSQDANHHFDNAPGIHRSTT